MPEPDKYTDPAPAKKEWKDDDVPPIPTFTEGKIISVSTPLSKPEVDAIKAAFDHLAEDIGKFGEEFSAVKDGLKGTTIAVGTDGTITMSGGGGGGGSSVITAVGGAAGSSGGMGGGGFAGGYKTSYPDPDDETDTDKKGSPMSVLLETDKALAKFDKDLRKSYTSAKTLIEGHTKDSKTTTVLEPGIAKPVQKKYVRPNGEVYLPRTIKVGTATFKDVAFIEQAHFGGLSVLLYGPPGTGKTALIEATLDNVVTVAGSIETEAADFEGGYVQQPDGTYLWIDGPAVVAAENGWPLLIDEIALIDPRQLSKVYALMDGRGEMIVSANPERGVVKAQPGFMVYGATNPDVPGAVMSEALLSRFSFHVEMKTDWNIARSLGIESEIIQVARNLHTKGESGIVTSPPQLRELIAFKAIKESFGMDVALSNFVGQARPEDQVYVTEAIKSVYGATVSPLTF